MNLIEELTALQDAHGHLRDSDLRALAARTRTPLHHLQGLCSFYPHFRREAPARLEIRACRDLSCHLSGAEGLARDLEARCATRDDARFATVSCLGRCDGAPACTLNDLPVSGDEARACLDDPGRSPQLLVRDSSRFALDPYASAGERYGVLREWQDAARDGGRAEALIARLEQSDLCGMGGAAFPTGRKWRLVRDQPATPRYVICNADESEPGTFKDRALLASAPHLVVEGMLLAALAIGSREGWVYIRHEYGPERQALQAEIARAREGGLLGEDVFGSGVSFELRVFVSPGGYVLGEETALLEALEGKRGEPRNKPPYPGVRGLWGRPTLINNVETFAQVPRVLRSGSVASKLFSVSGDVEQPGVIEAPLGTTLRELVARCGGLKDGRALAAFLPGGASTGFLGPDRVDLPLDWQSLREAGSALGSAAVLVVAEGADLRGVAANLTAFFRNESCGKCVPCRVGTERALKIIEAPDGDLSLLPPLHEAMAATSICGLGQAALIPATSLLDRLGTEDGEPS